VPTKGAVAVSSNPTVSVSPPPYSAQAPPPPESRSSKNHLVLILAGAIGGAILILIIGVYICKSNTVDTVKPWATGLSGQLQKAFVTGKSSYSLGREAEMNYIFLDIFVSFGLPSHL
jgi:hypothetical protein